MSRKIKLWEDPYGDGNLYKKKSITFYPGLTVLVGCNGIGKTTLLHNIADNLKENKIPFVTYDNLKDGGENAKGRAGFEGDYSFLATAAFSSEGENIVMNLGVLASKLRNFIVTGEYKTYYSKFVKLFKDENEEDEDEITTNERWILLDAIDSGFSVDNICEVKELFFSAIFEDAKNMGKEVYIIVSANEYELANGENCLDVVNGKYVKFKNYDEYKELILKSREEKDKREDGKLIEVH